MNNNNKKETWLKEFHLGFANSLARTRQCPTDLQMTKSPSPESQAPSRGAEEAQGVERSQVTAS